MQITRVNGDRGRASGVEYREKGSWSISSSFGKNNDWMPRIRGQRANFPNNFTIPRLSGRSSKGRTNGLLICAVTVSGRKKERKTTKGKKVGTVCVQSPRYSLGVSMMRDVSSAEEIDSEELGTFSSSLAKDRKNDSDGRRVGRDRYA